MNNSVIYNNAGKTLIVDKIIERKSSKIQTQAQKEQYSSNAIMLANYSKIKTQLLTYVDDNYLTSNEKLQFRKELLQIDSSYSSLKIQAEELFFNISNSSYNQNYLNCIENYNAFKNFINPFLETNEAQIIDSSLMENLLSNYYSSFTILEQNVFSTLYGSTKKIDIELTSEFFVFKDSTTPSYEPQIIQAKLITWNNLENAKFYVNGILTPLNNQNTIPITLENISDLEEVTLRLVSGELETIKIIRKVFNGDDSITVQIISNNGTIFRMGQNFTTSFQARVWQGGKEITELFKNSDFRWYRISNDAYSDSIWNSEHYSTGEKVLTITQNDVVGNCNFFCDLLKNRS
ncbi:MAG: hypothetical protein PQJ49_10525 [Sphaerochaetaceae bacterium]|nr:hypothetical protein [Sphaerochaetaceae bacterium]